MTTPTRKPDGTIEFPLTISQSDIKKAQTQILTRTSQNLEIKGFRKGKAPLNVVEQNLDPQKISEQVLDQLLPQKLASELTVLKLHPISHPHLKVVSMEPGKDWQFTIEIAEFPQFQLGDYQTKIKSALASSKIVTSTDAPAESEDKQLKKVFDTLLDSIEVTIPHMLIAEEVNRALSRLLQQVQKLGLTIEQYLGSLHKTSQTLRAEYETTAKTNLKLEFILQKISQDLKIAITPTEIDAMIAAIPDPKTRETYNTPQERSYISGILRKRKTIDSLLKLV